MRIYSHYSQGWRIEMEDAHTAVIGIPDQKDTVSWFAVFDGHAGSRVSAHCSNHLLDCIRACDDFTNSIQQVRTSASTISSAKTSERMNETKSTPEIIEQMRCVVFLKTKVCVLSGS